MSKFYASILLVAFRLLNIIVFDNNGSSSTCSAYKILLFAPGHSSSQILFNYRFGDMIASYGHNVTIFVAHYSRNAKAQLPNLAKVVLFEGK